MPKKKPQEGKPQVHKELEGFEVEINEFGQIISNKSNNELNEFLNKEVDDKKLRDREDLGFNKTQDVEDTLEDNIEDHDDENDDELNLEDIDDNDLLDFKR